MPVSFGGETAWKVQRVGDLVRSYHWVSDEPAMVIFPQRPRLNAGAYVICLSSAFLYNEIPYLVKQSAKAAEVMGMDSTGYTIHRIGTVINDGLLDLIKMPPEPKWHKERELGAVVGELEVKRNGKIIMERDVREHERGNING